MNFNKFVIFSLFAFLIMLFSCDEKPVSQIQKFPLEYFFKKPEKSDYHLSPDGHSVAFLQPWENRINIFVQKLPDGSARRLTSLRERDVLKVIWVNNSRLLYVYDPVGNENYQMFSLDIDGQNQIALTPDANVKSILVHEMRTDSTHILAGLNKMDKKAFDIYKLQVYTGDAELVAPNPGNVVDWSFDNNDILRIMLATDGVNMDMLYRVEPEAPFTKILSTNFKENFFPLQFTEDNRYVYASSNLGRDKRAIVLVDPENGSEIKTIYEHPDLDVYDLLKSAKRNKITGVVYIKDKKEHRFFDEEQRELQKKLERELPGLEVIIQEMSRDERKVLVRTYSDRSRGAYYYFDKISGSLTKLSDISPWLDEQKMAVMTPIKFFSRDSVLLRGYLTLPPGKKAIHLPTIVMPHGGPSTRDVWSFNSAAQFLANRGYAVLQVNYRGSIGYGRDFFEAGFKQWGGLIVDDIIDGVDWLVSEKIADSSGISIYGNSFGGYLALQLLIREPDKFCCAIAQAPVVNIFSFLESIPAYWEPMRQMLYEQMGDPIRDKDLLTSYSPVFNADKIIKPVLLIHGRQDVKTPCADTEQFAEILRQKGIETNLLILEDEGHQFIKEENNYKIYTEIEKFLSSHHKSRK